MTIKQQYDLSEAREDRAALLVASRQALAHLSDHIRLSGDDARKAIENARAILGCAVEEHDHGMS